MEWRNKSMRCPKCGMQIQPNHQEIYETKTKITRYYDCRYCRHKFRTVEKIVEESEGNKQLS